MSFISAFNAQREKCLFSFFIVDETSCARDLIKRDSLTKRERRSSRIVDLWTIVASFMFIWAHLRFFNAFKINLDSHSICSLSCRIFCELSTTCHRHACDIARVIVADSYAAEWFVIQIESVELILSVISISVWISRPWKQIEVIWFDSDFVDSNSVN